MCLAYLHIPLREFYEYTPIEIDFALKAFYDLKDVETKLSWEQTRTTIYYNYLLTPSSKTKMSYESFRRTILPLSFDEEQISKEETIANDDTFKFMYEYFNKGANKE